MAKRKPASEVPVEKLRWRCDPTTLGFRTTDEIKSRDEIIGQARALKAIRLGLEVKSPGYNIYVAGLTGTGRTTTIKRILENIDTQGKTPDDICYVNNFRNPDMPVAIYLPAGQGSAFARDLEELVAELNRTLPRILDSEEFKARTKAAIERFADRNKALFRALEQKIEKAGFAVVKVEMGPFSHPEIMPVVDGKVMSWEDYEQLVAQGKISKKEFTTRQERRGEIAAELEKTLRESRVVNREANQAIQDLKLAIIRPVVKGLIADLKDRYALPRVVAYLDDAQQFILEHLDLFKEAEEKETPSPPFGAPVPSTELLNELKVNVVVDNSSLRGVPVLIETAPTYKNLFGTIERTVDRSGVWRTDFTRIKAGSLVRANGGYLVLNLLEAMLEPGVWSALKRTLKNRQVDVQAYDPFYLLSTSALKPEAIDVNVKVVIIGETSWYYLLYEADDDFKKIFKVRADFDTVMPRDEETVQRYAAFIKKICADEKLLPLDRGGVAAVVEYGVRLAGRQNKISTRFSDIADVIREAHFWATEKGDKIIAMAHVDQAIAERIERSRMIEEKIQEMIDDGTLLIDIAGNRVGQVNGLTVYDMGDYSFGRPARITAEVGFGRAGIINIEREAGMSGKTHNKGVAIIGGFLRGKYAQDKPLSMSGSLAFEQSYSGVDGDSASSTEIYALLSALSGLPLRQDLAVTGSVNQKGEIQPIGGVNQKIEGFFDVCKARGLTGKQGVLIPMQNIDDLMLRKDVVDAVKKKKFHIYPVKKIDEGIELLTGVEAGKKSEGGKYPKGSVHFLVDKRLRELAEGMKTFDKGGSGNSG